MEKERNNLQENYSVKEQENYIICCKVSIQNGVSKKESFRINKSRLTGFTLNFPEKVYQLISNYYDNRQENS